MPAAARRATRKTAVSRWTIITGATSGARKLVSAATAKVTRRRLPQIATQQARCRCRRQHINAAGALGRTLTLTPSCQRSINPITKATDKRRLGSLILQRTTEALRT